MNRFELGSRVQLFFALLAACLACAAPRDAHLAPQRLDGSAIEAFWAIQDRLMLGEPVEESAWDALFDTPAFQWQANGPEVRARIRARMLLAFQPDPGPLESELATAEGYDAIRWRHYERMRDERQELGRFYQALLSSNIVEEALGLAQEHLAPGSVHPAEWSTPVHLLFFGPDAFADGGAVYLDLVEAYDRGERLRLLLAHEFHHDFYAVSNTLPDLDEEAEHYWITLALTKLHMEGVADRIDKESFPLLERPGGSPGYEAEYNQHYRSAGETLVHFDAALSAMAGMSKRAEAGREAWSLLHLGAHPEGFFMANTVAEALGEEALVVDLGDPFAFLRRFQSVRPTFSARTLTFLDEVEAELRR